MKEQYFVTGIGTNVGKTFISALLTLRLHAKYWKPIQAGNIGGTDQEQVQRLTGLPDTYFFPSQYVLATPASPHYAATIDQVKISVQDFSLPTTDNLIVEGAGGVFVPLNETESIADLIMALELPVILVSQA